MQSLTRTKYLLYFDAIHKTLWQDQVCLLSIIFCVLTIYNYSRQTSIYLALF